MKEKFCPEQIKCKEDTDKTWSCTAHMAEGRVRECPYKDYADSQKGKYPCADARIGYEDARKPSPPQWITCASNGQCKLQSRLTAAEKAKKGGIAAANILDDLAKKLKEITGEQNVWESVKKLTAANERIKKMSKGDLSPESIFAGYSILVKSLEERQDELRDQLAAADEKNKRLRDVLEEIEAVACGETQIESDGSYDDSDGMKWIYDRIQSFKGE